MLNLYNNPIKYGYAFIDAATKSGSSITVNYRSNVSNIDNIVLYGSPNLVKGNIIN